MYSLRANCSHEPTRNNEQRCVRFVQKSNRSYLPVSAVYKYARTIDARSGESVNVLFVHQLNRRLSHRSQYAQYTVDMDAAHARTHARPQTLSAGSAIEPHIAKQSAIDERVVRRSPLTLSPAPFQYSDVSAVYNIFIPIYVYVVIGC